MKSIFNNITTLPSGCNNTSGKKQRNTAYLKYCIHLLLIVPFFLGTSGLVKAQSCSTGSPTILAKWDFVPERTDCNGAVARQGYSFGGGLGGGAAAALNKNQYTYCPGYNSGCGEGVLGSIGHFNTNNFAYALCLANFYEPTAPYSAPYDPTSTVWNPDGPANIYINYLIPEGSAGCLTSFVPGISRVGAGDKGDFETQGVTVYRNGVQIYNQTLPIAGGSGPTFNFPNTSGFCSDGSVDVQFKIVFGLVHQIKKGSIGYDDILINGTCGSSPSPVASVNQATCGATSANADGSITLTNFGATDKYDYTTGSTYTGTATYATGSTTIPVDGIITSTLANPTTPQTYTVRVFTATCYTDRTVTLKPIICVNPNACTDPPYGMVFNVVSATCTGSNIVNSDAQVEITGVESSDKIGISAGEQYTGVIYANAQSLSGGAYTFTGLPNPVGSQVYTIRAFNGGDDCFADSTFTLNQKSCGPCQTACVSLSSIAVSDAVLSNNTACYTACTGTQNIDLKLTAGVSPTTGSTCGSTGTDFVWTFTLQNTGTMAATDIQIADATPFGLAISSSNPSTGTHSQSGGWLVPSLAAGASATLTVTTKALVAGTYKYIVEVMTAAPLNDPNSIPGNGISTEDDYSSATATVTGNSSPTISKEFSPMQTKANMPTRLTIKITNNESTPVNLTADFIDTFPTSPAAMVVATTPNLSSNLTGVIATAGGTSIKIPSGTVLLPGLNQISVDVTVPSDGTYCNDIAVGSLKTTVGNNCVVANACVTANGTYQIPPSIKKSFSASSVNTNTNATLTITIQNQDPLNFTLNENFVDFLPAGLILGGATSGTCPNISTFGSTNQIGITAGAVISSGSCTIVVPVKSATAGTYCNKIVMNQLLGTIGTNVNIGNQDIAEACLTVVSTPCTTINLTGITPSSVGSVVRGGTVNLSAEGIGKGSKTLYRWTNTAGGAFSTQNTPTTWTAPQTSGTYTISVVGDNTLTGYGTCSALATYSLTVVDPPVFDLALTKILANGQASTVASGATVTFNVGVINQGNVDATNVQLTDYIPTGLTLNDPTWTAVGGKASLNTPIPSILAGQTVTRAITFTVNSSFSGTVTNSAEISAATGGTDIDSSPDSDNTNDGTPKNDVISENHKTNPLDDEDDSDVESLSVVSCTNTNLAASVVMSPTTIRSQSDIVQVTYALVNKGGIAVNNVTFNGKVTLFNRTGTSTTLTLTKQGDTGNDGIMLPNEAWIYTGTFTNTYSPGDVFVVTGEANGLCGGVSTIKAAAADLLYTVGINMDVQLVDACYQPGSTIKANLVTRLLIDEDAALNPGSIDLGGIVIPLPKRHFEGRNLMITVNGVNGGVAFNPFSPPAGVNITAFTDQGSDSGHSTTNILDESEPINTFRAPCTAIGQNDVSCDFPDWVFRIDIPVPANYSGTTFNIAASDAFTLFQAIENPAGSGTFGTYTDITPVAGAGGADTEIANASPVATIAAIATNPTCGGPTVNVDGKITLTGFATTDKYAYSTGSTYGGTTIYATASAIPTDGVLVNNLANPSGSQTYTVRIFNASNCYIDRTVTLTQNTCSCPIVTAPVITNVARCGVGTLNATLSTGCATGSSLKLFSDAALTTNVTSQFTVNASLLTSPSLTSVTTYYATCVHDTYPTCSSSISSFTLTVNALPAASISASATNATCNVMVSNNDGAITLAGFANTDKYAYTLGSTYIGSTTYAGATSIPSNGIVLANIVNPAISQAYTVRIINSNECYIDHTATIMNAPCNVFDLALTKKLGTGQAATVAAGGTVTFTISVINQGNVDAANVQITDYIPTGLTLNDPNWTLVSGKATLNTPISSLIAGQTTTRDITFTVGSAVTGTITNTSEISAATGGTDYDSTPDAIINNDDPVQNDLITGHRKQNSTDDEDDHDIESITVVQCTNADFAASLLLSPNTIHSQSDVTQLTYALVNNGQLPLGNVNFAGKVKLFNSVTATSTTLTLSKQGDTNNDGIMNPNEAWIYTGTFASAYTPGDVFIITGEANAVCGGVSAIKAAAADLLYTVGVNMDVQIVDTCYKAGGTMKVDLITRLLIDEDMALNPGSITVGGITIPLPKRHFEGRNLMITVNGVNGGLAFNPFNPPAGLTITPFIDQAADKGRNINNVLDESEPIDSIRNPCTAAGQNDISCEFPDWVFRMQLSIPTNQTGNKVSVTASDEFNLFQSVENPVGSGLFDAFVDITPSTGAGGVKSDSISLCVDNCTLTKPTINTITPTPATCNASTVNNNAKINIKGILNGVKYSWGTDTTILSFTNASPLVGDSITITGLVNPSQSTTYYFRIYNSMGCYITVSTVLKATNCSVCQGVTYTICPGENYLVNAPVGTTGIQWYRNGVAIPSPLGTTTNLLVSSIGEYTFTSTSSGSSCIDSLCCPVKVIAGNCCSKPTLTGIAATGATCNGSIARSDASINITGVLNGVKYAWGTDTTLFSFTNATVVSGNTINIAGLANPSQSLTYYFRIYNSSDCYTTVSTVLSTTICGNCPGTSYTICPGESYLATTPSGTTGVQWYKNGIAIPAPLGTGTTLVISTIGQYTFVGAGSSAGCSDTLCCPINVVAGSCCSQPTFAGITATKATCNGNIISNNATITLTGVLNGTKYAYGTDKSLFNPTVTQAIGGSTINIGGIANPSVPVTYYIRIYGIAGDCYTDTSVVVNPTSCPVPCQPVCLPIGFKRN